MATNEWAHAALCTLFNVADDTSAVNKALIPELKVRVLWLGAAPVCMTQRAGASWLAEL